MFANNYFSLAFFAGFRVVDLIPVYEYDQVGIKATERFDFVAHDLGDTSTAGPVVGLIGE